MTKYQSALDYLYARTTGGFKFGLERTVALLTALGDPHREFSSLHVGGTNGKGSVVATCSALLRARGHRVGRYTSPHLVDFRERIVVDEMPIPEATVVEFIDAHIGLIDRLGATFFEATTAMAFWHFARERVDIAMVEVGLGGRLDSTNVIDPVAAAVTSIGLDHTEYLGPTVEAIAREKAGIFKPRRPAVIGEPDGAIAAILAAEAHSAGADPVVMVPERWPVEDVRVDAAGTHFSLRRHEGPAAFTTPLIGAHQASNFATAYALLDAAGAPWATSVDEAQRALRAVTLPGRFHRLGGIIFDVAHNPAGATVLADALAAVSPPEPVVALVAVLSDKDWRGMLRALAPRVSHFVLSIAPTSPPERTWNLEDAGRFAREQRWSVETEPDFGRALEVVQSRGGTAVVTGSFHTVGDAMQRLGIPVVGK